MARAAEGLTGGERNVPHRAELAKEVEKLLWGNVEAGRELAPGHGGLVYRQHPPQVLYEESSTEAAG
jgi:hypothetical protein